MLRVHECLRSSVNGPGSRATIWFQGCSWHCPGCGNPATHDPNGGTPVDPHDLAAWVNGLSGIEGITLTGGEPLEQPHRSLDLFLADVRLDLSIVLFTGYGEDDVPPLLRNYLDAAIVGPYDHTRPRKGFLPSDNQRLVLYSNRYTAADFDRVPGVAVYVRKDGTVHTTGTRY